MRGLTLRSSGHAAACRSPQTLEKYQPFYMDDMLMKKIIGKWKITELPNANNENDSWLNIAINGLSDAYSDNEPEYLLERAASKTKCNTFYVIC
jgi:hypothetical protein